VTDFKGTFGWGSLGYGVLTPFSTIFQGAAFVKDPCSNIFGFPL
jgi:hypothetical protein